MTDSKQRPLRVFLCHSVDDKAAVRQLYHRLNSNQVDVWLDTEKLLPGQDWSFEIVNAIKESDIVIVCLSKVFNQIGYWQKEVRMALEEAELRPEGTIFIIPIKLDDCDVPEKLKRWHWVNLFEKGGYSHLLNALKVRAQEINLLPPSKSKNIYGGMEGGGTYFVCVVGRGPEDIIDEIRFPTTTPDETLNKALEFFKHHLDITGLSGLGISSFGPLQLNRLSANYGHITTTPKLGWENVDVLGWFKSLDIPIALELDTNSAAFGEYYWNPKYWNYDSLLYLVIGGGVGTGIVANGQLLHGLANPEAGHARIFHNHDIDPFEGCCPFHKDCFEGLASRPAIEKRWGMAIDSIPEDHPAWDLETKYIASALANIILTISPQQIVLGGSVIEHMQLSKISASTFEILNEYAVSQSFYDRSENYIAPPAFGSRSAVMGAIASAKLLVEGK